MPAVLADVLRRLAKQALSEGSLFAMPTHTRVVEDGQFAYAQTGLLPEIPAKAVSGSTRNGTRSKWAARCVLGSNLAPPSPRSLPC